MEPKTMLCTAATLFGIGALGGLVMALMRLRGVARPPDALAMLHGLLGGAGLTLTIYAAATLGVSPMAQLALVLLLVAAAGGLWINLAFHARQLPLPIPAIIIHALAAAGGLGLLVLATMRLPTA